jgi:hypothetical protein
MRLMRRDDLQRVLPGVRSPRSPDTFQHLLTKIAMPASIKKIITMVADSAGESRFENLNFLCEFNFLAER